MGRSSPRVSQRFPTRSDSLEDHTNSSSDAPLAVIRGRRKRIAPVKTSTLQSAEDSDDDIPISSTLRKRLRAEVTTSALEIDRPRPPASFTDIQSLTNQLGEANREAREYRESLKKEQAKSSSLEQQRLLLQANLLNSQEEAESRAPRQPLSGATRTTQDRSGASVAGQEGRPATPLNATPSSYGVLFDVDKNLEIHKRNPEFARNTSKNIGDISSSVQLKSSFSWLEQKVREKDKQIESERQACRTAEQHNEALITTNWELQRRLEQIRASEHELSQKLQHSEIALKEANRNTPALEIAQVVHGNEALQKQVENFEAMVQQISDSREKEMAMGKKISDLQASNLELAQKAEQLGSQLQNAKLQLQETGQKPQETGKPVQSAVESNVASPTQEPSTGLNQRQPTVDDLKQHIEDIQEELHWYKNQLEKERARAQEEWVIFRQEQARILMDIAKHC